jgi:hypothetical protein
MSRGKPPSTPYMIVFLHTEEENLKSDGAEISKCAPCQKDPS